MLDETDVNNKRYLKQFFLENILKVQFICPAAGISPNRLALLMIEESFQNIYDSYQNIFQAAKIVRSEILAEEKWQFNESYHGFNVSRPLELLLDWILCDPKKDSETAAQRNEIEKSGNILS